MDSGLAALLGAIIGGTATLGGQILREVIQSYRKDKADRPRKQLLKQMLENPQHDWRSISVLSGVVGLPESETKRLLIEIGARGSEIQAQTGKDVWGLISRHPLP